PWKTIGDILEGSAAIMGGGGAGGMMYSLCTDDGIAVTLCGVGCATESVPAGLNALALTTIITVVVVGFNDRATVGSSTPLTVIACRCLSIICESSVAKRLIIDWVNCTISDDAVIERMLVDEVEGADSAEAVTVAVTVKTLGMGMGLGLENSSTIRVNVFTGPLSAELEDVEDVKLAEEIEEVDDVEELVEVVEVVDVEAVNSAKGSIDMTVATLGASGSSVTLIAMVGRTTLSEMTFGSDDVGKPMIGRSRFTVDMETASALASMSAGT
ncbi:hypothetical protein IWW47_005363, partial [Coemansia sp. RSA 2052]